MGAIVPGRPTFPGIGVIGVKSWQKPRENRGQSERSPRCLNAVNPAVALSAPKYQVPEKTCGKRTRWLTGAPINQRVGLFRSHNVGPAKGACMLAVATAPAWSWETTLSRSPLGEASSGRRWFPVAEQRLPALALFPPVRYPRQWLKLTQVNRVPSAAVGCSAMSSGRLRSPELDA